MDLILEGQWLVNVLIEYTIYDMITNIIIWLKWLVYEIYIYTHTRYGSIWMGLCLLTSSGFVKNFQVVEVATNSVQSGFPAVKKTSLSPLCYEVGGPAEM